MLLLDEVADAVPRGGWGVRKWTVRARAWTRVTERNGCCPGDSGALIVAGRSNLYSLVVGLVGSG